jgi:hypothetical protein
MPDGSAAYSFVLPTNTGSYVECVWDGVNWRSATAGLTIVNNAISANQAVALGQSTASARVYNVTSSRSFGTTYTNSHGKQLILGIVAYSWNTSSDMEVYVNGLTYARSTSLEYGGYVSVTAVVPPGATYEVGNSYLEVVTWIEEY